jgi:hypothetical protein
MKKSLIVLLALPFLFACNSEEKKSESVSNIDVQLKEKDEVITNYIKEFNEIQENLRAIKLREKSIALNTQSNELQKSNKDQIINDIQFIYDLLNKNKEALSSMSVKFKEVTAKNNEIKKLNTHLTAQVAEKEKEITFLKDKLNPLHPEIDTIYVSRVVDGQKKSEPYGDMSNTVYFAIGTYDELKKENLIEEKGGVIGIGKRKEINPNAPKGAFSKLDMYETREVSVAAKDVKLITFHPAGSYKLENTKLRIKKLVILDPAEFWSISKYLIVLVSADKPISHKVSIEMNHL